MQISQITNINTNSYKVNRLPQKTFYGIQQDTFVKSNVSFKSAPQNIFQIIKNNPNLSQTVMALIALGASTIAIGAEAGNVEVGSTTDSVNSDEKKNLLDVLGQMLGIKPAADTSKKAESETIPTEEPPAREEVPADYLEKIAKLERQNAEYLDKINELENRLKQFPTQETPAQSNNVNDNNQTQTIEFPKKHGRLSKSQDELKTAVTSIKVTGINTDLLINICKELLNKGTHDNVDNNDLAHDLSEEFTKNKDNPEKINEIISSYAIRLGLISETKGEPSASSSASNVSTSSQTQKGVTVVGKIDLNSVDDKKRRPRIPAEEIQAHEILPNTYYYKVTGTIKPDIQENLNDLFRCFKNKTIENRKQANDDKKIKWKLEFPVTSRVLREDVINELSRDTYDNINKNNAETIAEIINSDENFSKIFGLHAAMRFLDRFLDFDSEISLEEQASHAMKTLISTIRYSLKAGVMMEEYTTPFYPNGNYDAEPEMLVGLRLHIPEKYYSNEALELFGTYPLRIGISGERGYNKRGAVIDTIFKNGI